MNNSKSQPKKSEYESFHIIKNALKREVTLVKFENNDYVFEVDNEEVFVRKDARHRLIVDCNCKDCSLYNSRTPNILCSRKIAVYNYLLSHKGILREDDVQKQVELCLP